MTTEPMQPPHAQLAPALVYGFGTTAAMWVVGFVTHLPGIEAPPTLVGLLMLLTMLSGAALCGRAVSGHAPIRTGLLSGLACGLINLLILGSLLTQDDGAAHPNAALMVAGWLALSALIGVIGGAAGSMLRREPAPARPARQWAPAFAVVCVLAAIPVLFSGGLVTSHNAGLAVPDWPTSFNANMFMYPLSKMTGGIYYEHAHRLFGSLVGLTVLTFAICAFLWKTPKRVKVCAVIAFVLVLTQGIVGGLRVDRADDTLNAKETTVAQVEPGQVPSDYAATSDNTISRAGAVFHGVFGQLTLAFLCATGAVATARYAKDGTSDIQRAADPMVRYGSMALMLALMLQLTLGALSRHLESAHSAWAHAGFAFVVFALLAVVAMRATKHKGTPLPKLGFISAALVIAQIALGFVTLMVVLSTYEESFTGPEPVHTALIATLHQATGAALFSACTLLHIWALRCTSRSMKSDDADTAIA